MTRIRVFIVLVLLAGGAALATRGTADPDVSLSSVVELWTDTLRDVDQVGMKLTRVSAAEEMKIGADLALGITERGDVAAADYVKAVAQPLVAHVRRQGIRYEFHVIESPEINAFALPGGQIFVLTGLLDFVKSEAELAAVLGHEIAHVDLRHCIERYQYEAKLKKAGVPELGSIMEMAHRLATLGFSPEQELDADALGQTLSAEVGYDPDAAADLFKRMQAKFHEPARTQATTPAGEVAQAAGAAIGSYFRTHPPSEDRARRLADMAAKYHNGDSYYTGKQNLRERVPRSGRAYPEEFHRL
ncbi:MAG TPA: M48 family metalloprotease [Bryobacteraceae bacterium]